MDESKKEKIIFWVRFALWVISACLAPVGFIAWRFKLFEKVSSISISGWGALAVIIIIVFALVLTKYVKKGLPYSFATQCINGVCKVVVPLLTIYLILYFMRENIDLFLQALGCVVICELVAVPLNPMPKWVHDNKVNEQQDNFEFLLDKFFEKKKESEGK